MSPGRNDPCPCGSGRKYKQCCLARDETRAADEAGGAPSLRGGGRTMHEQVRAAAAAERTWAADAIPLLIGIDDGTAPRPVGMLVMAGELVVQSDVRGRLRGEVSDVAAAIDRAVIAAARDVGAFPERLRVRHAEVATALAPLLAPHHIAVEAASLPELEEAAVSLMEHMAGDASWPPICRTETWRAWDLPLPLVARLFAAAAHFYRLRPWRDIANLQAPRAVLPSGRVWTCAVLGNAGEEFGLALYSAASDLFDVLVHNEPYDAFADIRGRILTLTFEAAATAGAAAVREARLHRWELAGPAAYPVLITVNTPGGGAARADVEDMIALLHAVPAFVQQHGPVLRREDATGAPAEIDWEDPASGIVFHYAGEAVLVEADDDTDEALEDSLLEQHDEIRAALTEAVRDAQAEVGEDAPEKALLDAINRSLQQKMTALNDRPQAELGGLAPAQLTRLLRSDWVDPDGAVRIRADLTADDVAHARLLDHARTLLELAIERGNLRATQAGNLKLDTVNELRERMRFDDDDVAELRSDTRRITEQDARPLHQIRVVCDLAGLLRRRGNYFEPTQQARSLIEPAAAGELFALLFRTWFRKFNMAYGTRVEWPELQYQIAYTLYRLPVIASDWRTAADMIDEVVVPYALEQARLRTSPFPDLAASDLAVCALDPLVAFGLLERRNARSRLWRDAAFRATALACAAIRFEL